MLFKIVGSCPVYKFAKAAEALKVIGSYCGNNMSVVLLLIHMLKYVDLNLRMSHGLDPNMTVVFMTTFGYFYFSIPSQYETSLTVELTC
jgi:hypothetical protein